MFPTTKNMETSFRAIRWLSLVAVVGSMVSGVCFFVMASRVMLKAQSTVYILSAGKAFEAFAGDREPNLRVEATWDVINFHTAFFTLEADEKFITSGLKRALYLVDGSGKRIYDNLKEKGYFAEVVSANISQHITVDSVALDLNAYPFYFKCYATERIIRPTSIVTRGLVTEGWLRNVDRSDNNEHGLMIERWAILENPDIKVEQR